MIEDIGIEKYYIKLPIRIWDEYIKTYKQKLCLSHMSLDSRDRRLIYELSIDSRQSIRSLAKKLNISKSAINYRINKLTKEKIIPGHKTYIDCSALGISVFALYLKFGDITPEIESEIVKYFSTKKEVTWLGKSYGNWELIVEFGIKSQTGLPTFLSKFYKKYSPHLREKELVRYTSEEIFGCKPEGIKRFKQIRINLQGAEKKVSEIERGIISYIQDNPDYKLHLLASELKIGLDVARKRIRELTKKKIILGHTAQINFNSLNLSWYILQLELGEYPEEKKFWNFLRTHKNTYYTISYIGKWDYEIGLCIRNSKELERFIFELKTKFPKAIKNYEFSLITELYKFN